MDEDLARRHQQHEEVRSSPISFDFRCLVLVSSPPLAVLSSIEFSIESGYFIILDTPSSLPLLPVATETVMLTLRVCYRKVH